MTTPILSLIIAHHNQIQTLQHLLTSIERQSFKNLEIIVVDDASSQPLQPLIEAHANKGMQIRCIMHSKRIYTRKARIIGIKNAHGRIIAFADADDLLIATDIMERHVQMFLDYNPDILHFRCAIIDQKGNILRHAAPEVDPKQPIAEGMNIFSLFAQSNLYYQSSLWNKYYSKQLCKKISEMDLPDNIKHFGEDLFLNSLCFFHATKYISSELVGYGYRYDERSHVRKSAGRAISYYTIMNYMLEYLEANGCPTYLIEQYQQQLSKEIAVQAGIVCREIYLNKAQRLNADVLKEIFSYADYQTWLNVLILSNGYNANKITTLYKYIKEA